MFKCFASVVANPKSARFDSLSYSLVVGSVLIQLGSECLNAGCFMVPVV